MSEVKLNLIDAQQVLHGTIHGSVADACVAALSAEPETIAELSHALTRYQRRLDDSCPFATFHSSLGDSPNTDLDTIPWDAGIVVIDLAARIVASESTYSMPEPRGEVNYHDGTAATDIPVLYRLPDDWLFVNSVEAYQWSRERRASQRLAEKPFDAREVLYGAPLLDFIVNECAKIEVAEAPADDEAHQDPNYKDLSAIHSRWLMTPREDLRGNSPRDVLFAKQDFIDFDLHTRSLQWSLLDEGPPCLPKDSHAYRFAGFGTHEWVIYYDLIRHLLWSALDAIRQPAACLEKGSRLNTKVAEKLGSSSDNDSLIARLEEIKTNWLEQPQEDTGGHIPAIIIENERKRLPEALRPRDMIIDDDCPVCQMFGDETSPLGMGVGFWHLDGSHMDDDFVFSPYETREEWETENRRREEFDKEFNRKYEERQQRIANGEPIEPDPFFNPDPIADLEFAGSTWGAQKSVDDEETELPQ